TYFLEDTDGSFANANLVITTPVNSVPTISSIPAVGQSGVTEVFEAGLPAHDGSTINAGAQAGQQSNTGAGVITFTSGDGVGFVSLTGVDGVGHTLTAVGQTVTFADVLVAGGPTIGQVTATLSAGGTISYSYVLTDNVQNTNGNPVDRPFTVVV